MNDRRRLVFREDVREAHGVGDVAMDEGIAVRIVYIRKPPRIAGVRHSVEVHNPPAAAKDRPDTMAPNKPRAAGDHDWRFG